MLLRLVADRTLSGRFPLHRRFSHHVFRFARFVLLRTAHRALCVHETVSDPRQLRIVMALPPHWQVSEVFVRFFIIAGAVARVVRVY